MVVKMAGLGRSFAGVAAYCLHDFRRAPPLECPGLRPVPPFCELIASVFTML